MARMQSGPERVSGKVPLNFLSSAPSLSIISWRAMAKRGSGMTFELPDQFRNVVGSYLIVII